MDTMYHDKLPIISAKNFQIFNASNWRKKGKMRKKDREKMEKRSIYLYINIFAR